MRKRERERERERERVCVRERERKQMKLKMNCQSLLTSTLTSSRRLCTPMTKIVFYY